MDSQDGSSFKFREYGVMETRYIWDVELRFKSDIFYSSTTEENLLWKKVLNIIKIRKLEAFMLREKGFGSMVKKSHSRKPTYYVVENNKVLRFLEDYREDIRQK